jgi:hypothetical protein
MIKTGLKVLLFVGASVGAVILGKKIFCKKEYAEGFSDHAEGSGDTEASCPNENDSIQEEGEKEVMQFSFDIPMDGAEALRKAKELLEEKGGTFAGDEHSGHYEGNGVKGSYAIEGKTVTIKIFQKPFFVPEAVVKSAVMKFFEV